MKKIVIGRRIISEDNAPYFIADIAANHDGNLNRAYKLIELAKEAGADAAKFQNFTASKIVSKKGFEEMGNQVSHQSQWKSSVYEVYEKASIPSDWSHRLKEKCDQMDIEYMTSPYDFESVDYANQFVNAFKIGSGDITWHEILRYISKKSKPVILATGASAFADVKNAVNIIQENCSDLILMQCNTNYTAHYNNFKHINLNVLKQYKKEFPNLILGLSDHTAGHSTVLGAIALGARVIEKHFTDDNDRSGPDHKFSLTPLEWEKMVICSNEVYMALGDGVKKIEDNEKETVSVQRRSLYYVKDLPKGHMLTEKDIFPLRPIKENGIEPYYMYRMLGKKLITDVNKDTSAKWGDIE